VAHHRARANSEEDPVSFTVMLVTLPPPDDSFAITISTAVRQRQSDQRVDYFPLSLRFP